MGRYRTNHGNLSRTFAFPAQQGWGRFCFRQINKISSTPGLTCSFLGSSSVPFFTLLTPVAATFWSASEVDSFNCSFSFSSF